MRCEKQNTSFMPDPPLEKPIGMPSTPPPVPKIFPAKANKNFPCRSDGMEIENNQILKENKMFVRLKVVEMTPGVSPEIVENIINIFDISRVIPPKKGEELPKIELKNGKILYSAEDYESVYIALINGIVSDNFMEGFKRLIVATEKIAHIEIEEDTEQEDSLVVKTMKKRS
jgi:hypothetical protein